MIAADRLKVRVNEELVLDAGACREVSGPDGPELVIRPPETTLFHQVLAYLRAKPDPPRRPSGSMVGREGVAAAALTLRWGSYLAVLLDRDKPVWSAARSDGISRICDQEMARINIEASAALAEWIDIFRSDPCGPRYLQLVDRAVCYLPMPKKTSKPEITQFAALAVPEFAVQLVRATGETRAGRLERVRADAERFPSRVLANALVKTAWRNGPVESIHAGYSSQYPLHRRRLTPSEESKMMRFADSRMAMGMTVCLGLVAERPARPWAEQALPYGLADMMLVTPSGWTLTETSREVRLPARPV